MAIIRGAYGGGQIKGSIAGTTFQQGPYGTVARNRTVPVNPSSARQVVARAAMTQVSAAWSLLPLADRLAWADYASQTPVLNAFGDQINITGRAMFIRTNQWLLNLGRSVIATAPSTPGVPEISTGQIGFDQADGLAIGGWNGLPPPIDGVLQVQVSPPISATRNFYKGPWIITQSYPTPLTFPQEFIAGADVVLGEFRAVRLRFQDLFGRLSSDVIQIVGPATVT